MLSITRCCSLAISARWTWCQVVLTSSVGMFLIAAGMIGYMLRDLNWGVRIVCIAAGLMLIHPGTLTDIIGIGVLVVVLVFQIITGKGSKAVKAA